MNYDKIILKAIEARSTLREQTRLYSLIGSGLLAEDAQKILRNETEHLEKKLAKINASIKHDTLLFVP